MANVYLLEAKMEFLKSLRMKAYSLSTVLFPIMFYCFFALAMGKEQSLGSTSVARYTLATYGAFSVMGATLFAFGVGVAVERGLGWLQVKRASPMPPAAYFVAKGVVSMAFGAIVVTLLFGLGAAFGEVRMPLWQWLAMGGALVAGAIPFCALGLAIGNFAGPSSAPATVNMIYLPMAFCSGLWIPFQFLPKGIQAIAPLLPSFHLSQIALRILGAPTQGAAATHVEALAGFTLLFAGIAWLGHAREREKMYG
jgi:ABC-2 type transport system permease protein